MDVQEVCSKGGGACEGCSQKVDAAMETGAQNSGPGEFPRGHTSLYQATNLPNLFT